MRAFKSAIASVIFAAVGACLGLAAAWAVQRVELPEYVVRTVRTPELSWAVIWVVTACSFLVCLVASVTYLGSRKRWLHNAVAVVLWAGGVGAIAGLAGGFIIRASLIAVADDLFEGWAELAAAGVAAGAIIGGIAGLVLNVAFGWALPWLTSGAAEQPSSTESAVADMLPSMIRDMRPNANAAVGVSEGPEGPRKIRLSEVYQRDCPKQVVAESEPEFLSRVLKCPSCRFNDEAARSQGSPWCGAFSPPQIKSFKCQTFRART